MSFRNTAILVALFALLAGYVFFVEMAKPPAEQAAQDTEKFVFTLGADDLTALEIKDGANSLFLVKDPVGAWYVGGLGSAAADSAQVSNLLYQLTDLRASRIITDLSAGLAAYGLASPLVEANLQVSGDRTESLLVGDKAPQGANYYAQRRGVQAVYLVPDYLVTALKTAVAIPPYLPTPTAAASITPTLSAGAGLTATPALTVTKPASP
jgi:hypothetical protein